MVNRLPTCHVLYWALLCCVSAVTASAVGVSTAAASNSAKRLGRRGLLYDVAVLKSCASNVTVVYKGDSGYEQIRSRISNPKFLSYKYPEAFGFPKSSEEASQLLNCGQAAGMKIAIRGGGHNYEGLSLTNGLVIDMRELTDIQLWTRDGQDVVTIGAGQRIGPVNAELWNNRKFVPTGICDSVGMAGVTLGGGVGANLRTTGLTADSLVEATVVTAAGEVLTVNDQNNSDLFWSLRGGGGNYAVVTSLTYKTWEPPATVSVLFAEWPTTKDNMQAVTEGFFRWNPYSLPDEYSYVELFLGGAIRVAVYHWGPQSDLQALYNNEPLFRVGSGSTIAQLREMDYGDFLAFMMNPWSNIPLSQLTLQDVITRAFDNNNGRSQYKASSAFLTEGLSTSSIEAFVTTIYDNKDKAWVQVHPMGGQANRVDVSATAFPHRNTQYELQIYIYEYNHAWIQSVQSSIAPHATGLQYVNYIDTDTASPWETYFGPNADRLKSIKAKWDPSGVFDAINQRD